MIDSTDKTKQTDLTYCLGFETLFSFMIDSTDKSKQTVLTYCLGFETLTRSKGESN